MTTTTNALPKIKYVQIQTQSRCNADCVFCPYIESWHASQPGRMEDALFDKILEELKPFQDSLNQGQICPYLMQEPLLDKDIFNKIDKIYKAFPDTLVEISTNSAALTEKVVNGMLSAFPGKRHVIWISHHGVDKKSLEFIMKINYEKSIRNITNLLKKSDGRLKIMLRGAGQSRNGGISYFDKRDYVAYWQQLFEREKINPQNISIDAFTFHDRAGSIQRQERGANLNNMGIIREIGPQNPFHCYRIDEWLHILYDGTIRLCCMDYHGEVTLPSLKDMSIVEYFQSDTYRQLVEKVTGKRESEPNFICKRCVSPGG